MSKLQPHTRTHNYTMYMRSLETPLSFLTIVNGTRDENYTYSVHQLISFIEAQKGLEAHGCKFSVTNLSIAPHILGMLTANVTCCINFLYIINQSQVNGCAV